MDFLISFGRYNHNHFSAQKIHRDKSLLPIIETSILEDHVGLRLDNPGCIIEV